MMIQKHPMLIYAHGFHSSPLSHKAKLMQDFCRLNSIECQCPQLANFPQAAAMQLKALVEKYKNDYQIGLVGSSLGGYLCTWLHQQYDLKAVLINPAVKPYQLLENNLGKQIHPYTKESYVFEPSHIEELKQLEVLDIQTPSKIWVMLQTKDEILNYRQALEKYQTCHQTVEEGGDHSFIGFERYLKQICQFLELY